MTRKILIVEDDPLQQKIMAQAMQAGGYESVMVADAERAMEILENEDIRFVITDWMLPGMDGPSFVDWIRSAKTNGYTYTILLTSRESPSDIKSGLEAGADDYITKPFDLGELLARVTVGQRILNLEDKMRIANERLEQQALIDDLTGLLNRRAIYMSGQQEISRALRHNYSLSALFLDLDGFKQINDQYGHLTGDLALKLTAGVLQSNLRLEDQIGRWAGDEFLVLLPDADKAGAIHIAQRILTAFTKEPIKLDGGELLILHASIGLYTWNPVECDKMDMDEFVRRSDQAMYHAKKGSGSHVVHAEDIALR